MCTFAHRLRCPKAKERAQKCASLLTLAKAFTASDGIRARRHPVIPSKRILGLSLEVGTLKMYPLQLSFTAEPQKSRRVKVAFFFLNLTNFALFCNTINDVIAKASRFVSFINRSSIV